MLGQAGPVGVHHVDVVIGEHRHHAMRQPRVELGGDHPGVLRCAATQPGSADSASGAALGDRAGAGGGQSGEQPAGLAARSLDVAAFQRHPQRPDHQLGQIGRSAHFNSLAATAERSTMWNGSA